MIRKLLHNNQRVGGVHIAFCCALTLFALAGGAHAQVLPLVTDPITTPELMHYADMLDLSDQQRLSLLSIHDGYKDRYRRFEDSDIHKLQDELLDVAMHFIREQFKIPPRDQLEGLLNQYRRVHTRACAVDRTLFDGMTTILTEQQLARLPGARTARELLIYGGPVSDFAGEMNEGAGVNLGELVRELDLAGQEWESATTIIVSYESAFLRKTRSAYGSLFDAAKIILDIIDEFGLREMTQQEMIAWISEEQVQASLKARFDDASKPLQAAAFEMSQLNLLTFRRFKPALSPESFAALRREYYRRGYREVYQTPGSWRERYEEALGLDDLTSDQKQAIGAQRDDFTRRDDQLVDRMVQTVEGWREYRTFDQFASGVVEQTREKEEYRRQREGLGQNAEAALAALLGPTLLTKLEQEMKSDHQEGSGGIGEGGGDEEATAAAGAGADNAGRTAAEPEIDDPFRPAALRHETIDQLAERLRSDGDTRVVLESLYDDYRARYDALRRAEYEMSPVTSGDEAEDKPPISVRDKRRRFDALAKLDEAFFDNVAVLVEDEARSRIVRAHRDMRTRGMLAGLARQTGQSWPQPEAYLDVASILFEADAQGSAEAAWSIIAEYANRMSGVLTTRAEAAVEVFRRRDLADRLRRRDPAAYQRLRQGLNERREEAARQLRNANREIIEINRRTLQQLLAGLPDGRAWEVRYAYNRAAYPRIFDDETSAEKYLTAALTEIDLTPQQRQKIGEIASDYRNRYFEYSEGMVQLRRKREIDWLDFTMPQREDIEREIQLERLRFDRDELSARTELRLRLELTEQQIRAIRGLGR